ncbi:Tubulin/FtsZ GTPase [Methanosalsum zhilinae DSM 4017]|uniref:Tubulin-like protein CetZ n=1 Tax=Methanosalsum zhilinae (strain DSM 4017 / NBRC 107636 / OCM 62 / WeN5) TaxID=679901 RepID=F7XPD9_METZD|nr:cell division protein FtsZ [Methanosalsum zhilinae]AEH60267.1 Tubulin/FtsZ GTPase [Methanosalsum zhilinae DSM 4017]
MLNILMIGNGQCGNRILDAVNRESFGSKSKFAKFYSKQKFKSNVETIAVNTAINDLKEMKFTKAKDRIHIPHLHGVGANRNIGKKVFEDNKEQIMRKVEERGRFDVAFVITSASGGTGSSFSPLLVKELKERYDYPVYSIVVLPFREEGTLYLQNAAFSLREMRESGTDGIILADNQFLKQMGGDVQSAYDGINSMIARRILFLIDSLDSEMMMVTDLGDFKTVMSGGAGLATVGFYGGDDGDMSVKTSIQKALSPPGLLFSTDVYEEASRAMIIIKGDRKYLNIDDISHEVEKLSSAIGHVFKGIIIREGEYPQVLVVLTLESTSELEKMYSAAVEAINMEREKKSRVESQKDMDKAFSQIEGYEPSY